MNDLLAYPEVPAAVIPFIVTLAAGLLLRRIGHAWTGLALIIGFIGTVLAVNGVELEPLTAARKIILCGIFAGVIGLTIDVRAPRWTQRTQSLIGMGIITSAWVMGIYLIQRDTTTLLLAAAGIVTYVSWLMLTLDQLRGDVARASSAIIALGIGTGLAAVAGSSGLLGQLGIAVGASGGALLLVALISKQESCGAAVTLPASILFGLLGCATVAFAELAWITLVILALIPLAARWMPVLPTWSPWVRSGVLVFVCSLLAAIAYGYAWYLSGGQTSY